MQMNTIKKARTAKVMPFGGPVFM